MTSDAAISDLAFYGFAMVLVQRSSIPEEADMYEVDLSAMYDLEVRPGYSKYGARAVFDSHKSVKYIYDCTKGKKVYPHDPPEQWNFAKHLWKCSALTYVTVVTHLSYLHWGVSNIAHIALRTQLPADHPIRRLMKIFIYNTGTINFRSTLVLYPEDSILHRGTALEYDSLLSVIQSTVAQFKYESFPQYLASKHLSAEMSRSIPIFEDGLAVFNAYRKFFGAYVDIFYSNDVSVTKDKDLVKYWECIDRKGNSKSRSYFIGLPLLTKENLIEYLANTAFYVTVMHEVVGTVSQYNETCEGAAACVRPGKSVSDVQTFIDLRVVSEITNVKQPKLINDWRFLLPGNSPRVSDVFDSFMSDLKHISSAIDQRNLTTPSIKRKRTCNLFNPKYLECSLSV